MEGRQDRLQYTKMTILNEYLWDPHGRKRIGNYKGQVDTNGDEKGQWKQYGQTSIVLGYRSFRVSESSF